MLAVIAVGVLLPWTRPLFMNNHYATVSGALIASMIIIPLQTVIPEELAFRGVLHGALDRAWGFRGVAAAGSLLFGLWHIASSLGLTSGNAGFTHILGGGVFGMVAGDVEFPRKAVAYGVAGQVRARFVPATGFVEVVPVSVELVWMPGARSDAWQQDRQTRSVKNSLVMHVREVASRALARYPRPDGIDPSWETQGDFVFDFVD